MRHLLFCAAACINFCGFLDASETRPEAFHPFERIEDLKPEVTQERFFELYDEVLKVEKSISALDAELAETILAKTDEASRKESVSSWRPMFENGISSCRRSDLTLDLFLKELKPNSGVDVHKIVDYKNAEVELVRKYIAELDEIFGKDSAWTFLKSMTLLGNIPQTFRYGEAKISFDTFVASKREGVLVLNQMSAELTKHAIGTLSLLDDHFKDRPQWCLFKWQCLSQPIPLVFSFRAVHAMPTGGILLSALGSDMCRTMKFIDAELLRVGRLRAELMMIAKQLWGIDKQQAAEALAKRSSCSSSEEKE